MCARARVLILEKVMYICGLLVLEDVNEFYSGTEKDESICKACLSILQTHNLREKFSHRLILLKKSSIFEIFSKKIIDGFNKQKLSEQLAFKANMVFRVGLD